MYLKLDESKWHKHTYEWSDRSKGLGRVDVYKGQIEVAEDVVPVIHAHWIEHPKYSIVCNCSNCGVSVRGTTGENYCFNCGAKMDEE